MWSLRRCRWPTRGVGRSLVAVAAVAVLGASMSQVVAPRRPQGAAGATRDARGLVVRPTGTVALGIYAGDPGRDRSLSGYIAGVGRRPAIVMWSQSWSEPLFYPDQMSRVASLAAVPMITWDPVEGGRGVPLSRIAEGDEDGYLRSAASLAAHWGRPLLIRFAHEMNLSGSSFGPGKEGNTAAEFVAAWRHVVALFRRYGATNVSWVWSPNVYCQGQCPFRAFYPGDAWVDWVGLDGYNYGPAHHVGWLTFAQIFGPSYSILASLTTKPMMIAEVSSTDMGGDKAGWIRQAFQEMPTDFPRIRAVVWWDGDGGSDWVVGSSPSSLEAYRQVASSPHCSGHLVAP